MRGSARKYDVRMAQFVLKIEKLSHIMGPRASQDLRSSSLIMAPGQIYQLFHVYFTSFRSSRVNELNKLTSLPMCGFMRVWMGFSVKCYLAFYFNV